MFSVQMVKVALAAPLRVMFDSLPMPSCQITLWVDSYRPHGSCDRPLTAFRRLTRAEVWSAANADKGFSCRLLTTGHKRSLANDGFRGQKPQVGAALCRDTLAGIGLWIVFPVRPL